MDRQDVNRVVRIPAITLRVGLVLAFAIAAGSLAYVWLPEPYKGFLIFFAAACAAAGQLAAALYSARTLQLSVELQEEAASGVAERERMELGRAALRFVERWNHPGMREMRLQWHTVLNTRGNPEALKSYIEQSDPLTQADVKQLLNFLEELALAVLSHYADEEVAKDLFHGVVLMVWHCTEAWIKAERARHRQEMWVQLENLYFRWR